MAVSGTYDFNLDIDEVIQEATEMIGGEDTLGHEPASARRSINLMLKDWQNRGVLLWTTSVSNVRSFKLFFRSSKLYNFVLILVK